MRKCIECLADKSLSEFRKWHLSDDGHRKVCKACTCAKEKVWRDATGSGKAYTKAYRERNPAGYAVIRCKQSAKLKGLEFNLDQHYPELKDRVDRGICEVTGVTLDLSNPSVHNLKRPNALSIDRVDSSKGYVLSNVRVVCLAVNLMLNVWGEEAAAPIIKAWATKLQK